jgi:hypothetical protein
MFLTTMVLFIVFALLQGFVTSVAWLVVVRLVLARIMRCGLAGVA